MTNERQQILIISFLGIALTMAVASICYGTIASKPIDVAAVQFAGTISGAFAALLVGKQQTPAAQVPPPPPEPPKTNP